MKGSAAAFRRLPSERFKRIDHGILESVGFWMKIYVSLQFKYLSMDSWDKLKYGEGVAFAKKAEFASNDIAPLEGCLHVLNDDILLQKKSTRDWHERYEKENSSAYFGKYNNFFFLKFYINEYSNTIVSGLYF